LYPQLFDHGRHLLIRAAASPDGWPSNVRSWTARRGRCPGR
jgi:hypothetical protein